MLLRNRKVLRTIAVFLLLNFLSVVFSDTIVALAESKSIKEVSKITGGTIPSSVNKGNVDLKTGDYSYSLPIMEVPGPEGSYPINLNYSAGIQLNDAASWVGLGWDLSAGGSITRSLNGFPDDFYEANYIVTDTFNSKVTQKNYNLAQQLSTDLTNINFFDNSNIPFSVPSFSVPCTFSSTGTVLTSVSSTTSSGLNAYGCLYGYAAQQAWSGGVTPSAYNNVNVTGTTSSYGTTFDCKCFYNPYYWLLTDNPENTTGGCVPQTDRYFVAGSGMSGEIQPLLMDNATLFRNSYKPNFTGSSSTPTNVTYGIINPYVNPSTNGSSYSFRFKNDFSNSFSVQPENWVYDFYGSEQVQPTPYSAIWTLPSGSPSYAYSYTGQGLNNTQYYTSNYGAAYNPTVMPMQGSNYISYYTYSQMGGLSTSPFGSANSQITRSSGKTYYTYTDPGTGASKQFDISNQIQAFYVTNPQGVTYWYRLPVYTYKSIKYMGSTSAQSVKQSRTLEIDQPYAYTWLLTSITGADFIDNGNGYPDEGDQGSWTNFNYGRYNNNYLTRAPYSGRNPETDGSSSYSGAYIETYYLDAVTTRTHTALFQKNTRNDNQGAYNLPRGGNSAGTAGSLQLQNILLYSNQTLKTFANTSSIYSAIEYIKSGNIPDVFDASDLSATNGLDPGYNSSTSKNLQYVNLGTDYSLCQGTPDNFSGGGKLTLKNVNFYAAQGTQEKPPVSFTYELTGSSQKTGTITSLGIPIYYPGNGNCVIGISPTTFNTVPAVGDILSFSLPSSVAPHTSYPVYAIIVSSFQTNYYNVYFIGPNIPSSADINYNNTTNITVATTKNPPYCSNYYDIWGYFKSDFLGITSNQNLCREVTPVSSLSTDVWSLRTIQTSLGATVTINYEADSYSESEYASTKMFNIKDSIGYSDSPVFNNYFTGAASQFTFNTREVLSVYDLSILTSIWQSSSPFINVESFGGIYNTPGGWPYTQAGSQQFQLLGVNPNGDGTATIEGRFVSLTVPTNPMAIPNSTNNYTFKHYGSYFTLPEPVVYGGGVRAKSITVQESSGGDIFQTSYDYINYSTGISSGKTSYTPSVNTTLYQLNTTNFPSSPNIGNAPLLFTESNFWEGYNQYYSDYMGLYAKASFYGDFIESGVIYSTVHTKEYGNNVQAPTFDEYVFQTYDDSLFQRKLLHSQSWSWAAYGTSMSGVKSSCSGLICNSTYCNIPQDSFSIVKLKDYTSCMGNLLSHRSYDLNNNVLNKTDYIYANAESSPNRQGVLEQVFNMDIINNFSTEDSYMESYFGGCVAPPGFHLYKNALTTVKGQYPFYLKKVISTDCLKGISNTTENKSFDFNTGQPLDVQSTDSYNNVKVATTVPAYYIYNSDTSWGMWQENMLTQPCAAYTYNTTTVSVTPSLSSVTPNPVVFSSDVTIYYYSVTLPSPLPSGDALLYNYNTANNINNVPNITSMINVNDVMYPISSITGNTVNFTTYAPLPSTGNYVRVKNEVLSAGIQTWTNGISTYRHWNSASGYDENYSITDYQFRPYRNYVWNAPYLNTDGSYNNTGSTGSYSEFNWTSELTNTPQSSKYWQNVKTNTLYDVYSNLLESKDINGNYVSAKKDYNHDNQVSSVSNSNYCSSFYWSFEDIVPTGVMDTSAEISWGLVQTPAIGSIVPHTGNYMGAISPTQQYGPTYQVQNYPGSRVEGNAITGKTYQASVWVHQSSDPNTALWIRADGTLNGSAYSATPAYTTKGASTVKVGNWYLLTTTLYVPPGYASLSTGQNNIRAYVSTPPPPATATAYIDDFMFHPVDANLTGSIYDPNTNLLVYQLDGNGFFTQYQYDNNHRLTATFKETLKGVKQVSAYQYVYK